MDGRARLVRELDHQHLASMKTRHPAGRRLQQHLAVAVRLTLAGGVGVQREQPIRQRPRQRHHVRLRLDGLLAHVFAARDGHVHARVPVGARVEPDVPRHLRLARVGRVDVQAQAVRLARHEAVAFYQLQAVHGTGGARERDGVGPLLLDLVAGEAQPRIGRPRRAGARRVHVLVRPPFLLRTDPDLVAEPADVVRRSADGDVRIAGREVALDEAGLARQPERQQPAADGVGDGRAYAAVVEGVDGNIGRLCCGREGAGQGQRCCGFRWCGHKLSGWV